MPLVIFVLFLACALTSHWCSRYHWLLTLACLVAQGTVLVFALGLLWRILRSPSQVADPLVAAETAVSLIVLIFATRHCHYLVTCLTRAPAPEESLVPLPSQQHLIKMLAEFATSAESADQIDTRTQLVSLLGEWGSGKTTLIRLLCKELQPQPAWKRFQDPARLPLWLRVWRKAWPSRADQELAPPRRRCEREPIIVFFNAWRHQSDPSLEVSLYSEIANEVLTQLRSLWWMRPILYPLFLSATQRFWLYVPGLGQNTAIDLRMRPPGVELFPHLRRLATAVEARKGRIVLVLDEIDRYEPLAAQAMLTPSQRFLQVQGILMILPFVMSQLRFKVFHPSVTALSEIRATSSQILEAYSEYDALLKEKLQDLCWLESMKSFGYSMMTDARTTIFPFGKELHPLMHALIIGTYYKISKEHRSIFYSGVEQRYVKTTYYALEDLNSQDFACLILKQRNAISKLASALQIESNLPLHELVRFHVEQGFGVDPDRDWRPKENPQLHIAEDSYFWVLCNDIWDRARGRSKKPIPLRSLIASLRIVIAEFASVARKRQLRGGITEKQRSVLFLELLTQALHVSVARLV